MEKEVNLLRILKKAMICRFDHNRYKEVVYMEPLRDKEEKQIDNSKNYHGSIMYDRRNKPIIHGNDIYMYGEINFNDPNDIETIKRFNLINHDNTSIVYSTFDYEKGIYTTIEGEPKLGPTNDPVLWLKYKHCLIGKPERVIIYKTII